MAATTSNMVGKLLTKASGRSPAQGNPLMGVLGEGQKRKLNTDPMGEASKSYASFMEAKTGRSVSRPRYTGYSGTGI